MKPLYILLSLFLLCSLRCIAQKDTLQFCISSTKWKYTSFTTEPSNDLVEKVGSITIQQDKVIWDQQGVITELNKHTEICNWLRIQYDGQYEFTNLSGENTLIFTFARTLDGLALKLVVRQNQEVIQTYHFKVSELIIL
ncbi:MAG: hypothetical protein O9302_06960 [Cyclobacteriaceae bacterium]|jgi:hypothetical protein|nr:hypothetical protein [Cytophagales bacterium]MCZ8327780.1 hypothetical protein [Cyclobacteriaceae bacterium]